MSFLSERSGSEMVGAVVGALVIGVIVRSFFWGGIVEYFDPSQRVENQLVAALEGRPGDLAVLNAMKEEFPLDYDQFIESMADAVEAGAGEAQVATIGAGFLHQFMVNHKNDFANAPETFLNAALESEAAVLERLGASSPSACGDYLDGTLAYDDPLTDEANRLLGEASAAYVRAMAAGRRDQQLRLAVTPADLQALDRTMVERGAGAAQMNAWRTTGLATLGDAERCDTALRALQAIDAQPAERRTLLTAAFLAPR